MMRRASFLGTWIAVALTALPLSCSGWCTGKPIMSWRGANLAQNPTTRISPLKLAKNSEYWQNQEALMEELTGRAEKSLKEEQLEKFSKRRDALLVDSLFYSAVVFGFLWLSCINPFVPFSYIFGSAFGLAYAYGLGKYVETVGGSVDDSAAIKGAGVGQARFAFLILLFVLVGKMRSFGVSEIPSILGFFTYQLASLSQGLKEIND